MKAQRIQRCECELCCDGEHAGSCKECAGWGSNNEEDPCSHCHGEGICPMCDGESANKERARDEVIKETLK